MNAIGLTLFLMLSWLSPGESAQSAPIPPSPITQLVLLGTGTPNAEPDRWGSALAVVVNGTPYLVDAGAGVVRRASAAYANGVEGLEVKRLSTLFLTHLHSDHTVGLPDLIYSPWVLERETPLKIMGPLGTEAMAYHLTEAYKEDVAVRISGLEPANTSGHEVVAQNVEPGLVYEDENVKVILVHEVYSQAGFDGRAPVWQRYHAASHTSGPELGRLASRARPKLLVLTHQLLWGATPEELVAEVRSTFDGTVIYGKDLDVF